MHRQGKAHMPYEFGVKVSVATTLKRSKGGQFALHAKALPGNPYDGHTLASVIPDMETTIGNEISRSSPPPAIAAITHRRATSSGSSPPARSAASPQPSSARCGGGRRSSR